MVADVRWPGGDDVLEAREVTLLSRHWQWLNAQPGGASVALAWVAPLTTTWGVNTPLGASRAAYHRWRSENSGLAKVSRQPR